MPAYPLEQQPASEARLPVFPPVSPPRPLPACPCWAPLFPDIFHFCDASKPCNWPGMNIPDGPPFVQAPPIATPVPPIGTLPGPVFPQPPIAMPVPPIGQIRPPFRPPFRPQPRIECDCDC